VPAVADLTVTVAICVRDGEKYITEAIESARRQIPPPIEVLVINDGSTDRSATIASRLGCKVVTQQQAGIGAARNTAIRKAKGDCVFFLDADDWMAENALRHLLEALSASPNFLGAIGLRQNFISPDLAASPSLAHRQVFATEPGTLPSGSLWRKEIATTLRFNVESLVADVQWILDFQELGLQWGSTEETVLFRRIHFGNTSSRPETRAAYLSLALKRLRKPV
jgi:glycosyltransferase involved in cell wall biosynthesis